MLAVDGAGRDAVVEVGHGLADLAPGSFSIHAQSPCSRPSSAAVVRVDLHAGHRPQLAAPRQLAMLAVEVHGDAAAGDAEDRVLLVGFRVAHPGVDALHVVGQSLGVEARRHLGAVGALREVGLDGGGPQLVLHGRRGEAGNVDVQLRRLLMRRLAVGLADLVAAVGAPVVREHFLHVPGAVLLVGGHEVVPGVIGSAAAAVLGVEALVLQGEQVTDLPVSADFFSAVEDRPGRWRRARRSRGQAPGSTEDLLLHSPGGSTARTHEAEGAAGALGDALGVHLVQSAHRQEDVRRTRGRRVPQVRLEEGSPA